MARGSSLPSCICVTFSRLLGITWSWKQNHHQRQSWPWHAMAISLSLKWLSLWDYTYSVTGVSSVLWPFLSFLTCGRFSNTVDLAINTWDYSCHATWEQSRICGLFFQTWTKSKWTFTISSIEAMVVGNGNIGFQVSNSLYFKNSQQSSLKPSKGRS